MKITKEQLKNLISEEISLMKMGDEHYHEDEYEGGCGHHEPMMGPETSELPRRCGMETEAGRTPSRRGT